MLNGLVLTCSAAPTVTFASGTNRTRVVLANGSTVTGMLTASLPGFCAPTGGIGFTITFGADYIGAPSGSTPV